MAGINEKQLQDGFNDGYLLGGYLEKSKWNTPEIIQAAIKRGASYYSGFQSGVEQGIKDYNEGFIEREPSPYIVDSIKAFRDRKKRQDKEQDLER